MNPVISYFFDEGAAEWVLEASIPNLRKVTRHILLKRIWVTFDNLKDLEDSLQRGLTQEDILGLMNDTVAGASYVRPILPSEVGDYAKPEATASDILARYTSASGENLPVTGYYFYLDHTIRESFMNHELLATCISSIHSAHKSHYGGYVASRSTYTPVNTSVYSTYPLRLVIGDKQVIGCKAGDVIRHSNTGGSGEYSVEVMDDLGLISYYDGTIRVIKNVSGTATLVVTDSNGDSNDSSIITVAVEMVE